MGDTKNINIELRHPDIAQVAYHGIFPGCDWDGNKLSGRFGSHTGRKIAGGPHCLVELRGDWKWHKEMWDLKNWYNNPLGICHRCKATRKGPNQFLVKKMFGFVLPCGATNLPDIDHNVLRPCPTHVLVRGFLG